MFDLQVRCCRSSLWLLLLDTGKSLVFKLNCSPAALLCGFMLQSSLHEAAICTNYN